VQWATLQLLLGNAEAALISRSEGIAISAHEKTARNAYLAALTVYTREQLPQGWAQTQNNLGSALDDLAARSEGTQASQYLQQAVDAYRSALQVRTREQLPQDWAQTQNNLGNALDDLAELSEGAQASRYLQQAVDAYRSALHVRTREQLPQRWRRLRTTWATRSAIWRNAATGVLWGVSYSFFRRLQPARAELPVSGESATLTQLPPQPSAAISPSQLTQTGRVTH